VILFGFNFLEFCEYCLKITLFWNYSSPSERLRFRLAVGVQLLYKDFSVKYFY